MNLLCLNNKNKMNIPSSAFHRMALTSTDGQKYPLFCRGVTAVLLNVLNYFLME